MLQNNKVLLITMPFGSIFSPSLGVSLLKGALENRGIRCDIRYLQLHYAALIGKEYYKRLSDSSPELLLGEWLFAHLLFGDSIPDMEAYQQLLIQYLVENDAEDQVHFLALLPDFRNATGEFIDQCMRTISWDQYPIIGFSTTFEQNLSSLVLAQRIKSSWPDKTIIFGGANCEGEMGVEIHRLFPWIDYVCSGESDYLLPELIQRLSADREIEDLQGLIYRKNGITVANGTHAAPIQDLDSLPIPDFDDYFEQLNHSGLSLHQQETKITIETSRGCWWGIKSQCTFCGLNGNSLGYRSKSSERVLEEIFQLAERYPDIKYVDIADNILDVRYFKDVIPGIIEADLGLSFFCEVKSNLTKEQLIQLKKSGIEWIQPGIESLHTGILKLMRKGTTAIQNIQLLKWSAEIGIHVDWNFLVGFPREDPQAYVEMAKMIPSLVHLGAPRGSCPIRLDRFSPHFTEPNTFGITNIRIAKPYRYVYPFPEENLFKLAYYFEFDLQDGKRRFEYTSDLATQIQKWNDNNSKGTLSALYDGERIILYDTRPCAVESETILKDVAKTVYDYCDAGHTFKSILRHLDHMNMQTNPEEVKEILDSLVERSLMLHCDDRYLSLALFMDDQAYNFIDQFVSMIENHHPGVKSAA